MKLNNERLFKNKYEAREDIFRTTEVLTPKKGKVLFVGLDCITDVQHFFGIRNFNILGIDKDQAKVDRVKKLGVNAEVKDVLDLDENEKYNLIWIAEGLNTLSDDEAITILNKASKLLDKRGFIFCSFAYRFDDKMTAVSEGGIYYRDEFQVDNLFKAAHLKGEEHSIRIVKDDDDKVVEKWYSLLASNI